MSSVGPGAAAAAFDSGGGTKTWTNATNAGGAPDGVFATMVTTTQTPNEIAFNQFSGFTSTSIPAGSTITGLQLDMKGKVSTAGAFTDTNLSCVNGASTTFSQTNQAFNSSTTFGITNAVVTYGGPGNTWNPSSAWQPADFDAGFTVYFDIARTTTSSRTFSLDSASLTVYYTPPATSRFYPIMLMGVGHGGSDAGFSGFTPTGFQTLWESWWFTPITGTYSNFHVSGDAGTTGIHATNFSVDVNYELLTTNSDPTHNFLDPSSWGARAPGTAKSPAITGIHMPTTFNSSVTNYGGLSSTSGENSPTIYWNTDSSLVYYINGCCRVNTTSDLIGYLNNVGGNNTGTHGGSGTRGGYITHAELVAGVIYHKLAINIQASKYLSGSGTGFVSPALVADGYYNNLGDPNHYAGPDATVVMGSMFAIPAGTTAAGLGITSTDAVTIFNALKAYGCIVVDDTAWDDAALHATPDAAAALYTVSSEIQLALNALQHVT